MTVQRPPRRRAMLRPGVLRTLAAPVCFARAVCSPLRCWCSLLELVSTDPDASLLCLAKSRLWPSTWGMPWRGADRFLLPLPSLRPPPRGACVCVAPAPMSLPVRLKKIVPEFRAALSQSGPKSSTIILSGVELLVGLHTVLPPPGPLCSMLPGPGAPEGESPRGLDRGVATWRGGQH